jgi:hypothetical protein
VRCITVIVLLAAGATASGCGEDPHASLPLDKPYSPIDKAIACLTKKHLPITKTSATALRIGDGPGAPSISFTATFDEAEGIELRGQAEGAERIGSALLFVGDAPDSVLKEAESCLTPLDTSLNKSA